MNLNLFIKLLAVGYFFAIAGYVSVGDSSFTHLLIQNLSFLICIFIFAIPKIPKYLLYSLLVAITFEFLYLLPNAPNHRHVLFFIVLIVAFSLGKEDLFQRRSLPAIRWLAILVYFFAFFAKLNWSYLEPKNSCSVMFYGNILKTFPFFPKGELVEYFVIYSSILVELLLPLLLLFRPAWGLLIGVFFHAALALDFYKYFINFSSVMFVCLSSFIEKGAVVQIFSQKKKLVSLLKPFFIAGAIFTILAEYYNDLVLNHYYGSSFLIKYVVWFGLAAFVIYVVFSSLSLSGLYYKLKYKIYFPEVAIITLVLLNGLSPYFGFKTRTSFNMYSNMQITSKDSNHLVISKSLDILNYLKEFEESGKMPENILAKKLLLFREINSKNSQGCIW